MMVETFNPSQRQIDIFSAWETSDSNILINAVAGSGKTTTLLQLLNYCEYKTLFLAFNKSVQEEIQAKIDSRGLHQGKAMTLHSLGLMAVRNKYRRFKINKNKNFEILKTLQSQESNLFPRNWTDKLKLGYTLMDMNDVSRLFLTNDVDVISGHFTSMDKIMFEHDNLLELWSKFTEIRESYYEQNILILDYTDMIYIPVYQDITIPIDPTYLMIDEAQDLNLCQHSLIDKLIEQSVEKWIAVGDRNQSIYGFSGAYSSSFDLFLSKGDVVELPLDICYRCDNAIVDMANEVYPVMEYSGTEEGFVGFTDNPQTIEDNSMVICRNSGPLIDLYFQLLGLGKPCYIKGEDILTGILRFLKPYNNKSVDTTKYEMMYKLGELELDKTDRGRLNYYVFKENYNNFRKLAEYFCEGHETIDTLCSKVKALFINKENAIMLCTIHKSKGLESDTVYILNEYLIPSRFARSSEQLKQESNLKYVARTRAKHKLYLLEV